MVFGTKSWTKWMSNPWVEIRRWSTLRKHWAIFMKLNRIDMWLLITQAVKMNSSKIVMQLHGYNFSCFIRHIQLWFFHLCSFLGSHEPPAAQNTFIDKANLSDLIAVTRVTVRKRSIRVKIDEFLSREIWWMTLNNNKAPLLYYTKLCS